MSDTTSGLLLALEGLDGAGKTTQVDRIRDQVRAAGRAVTVLSLYGNPLVGTQFFRLNHLHEIGARDATLVTAAEVAGRTHAIVEPALARGEVVLWDKYVKGSWARDRARGVREDILAAVYEPLPPAMLTIHLDVDPDVATARKRAEGGPGMWESGLDVQLGLPIVEIERRLVAGEIPPDEIDHHFATFQRTVRDGYRSLLRDDPTVVTIDTTDRTADQVAELVGAAIGPALEQLRAPV